MNASSAAALREGVCTHHAQQEPTLPSSQCHTATLTCAPGTLAWRRMCWSKQASVSCAFSLAASVHGKRGRSGSARHKAFTANAEALWGTANNEVC